MKNLIIIPTYNEKENIGKIIPQLFKIVSSLAVFVVDDGSPDKTAEEVRKLVKEYPNLILIERKGKGGRGSAVLEGFRIALKDKKYTHFVEMDADFSHDPKELPLLLAEAKDNLMVVGSRYVTGSAIVDWPLFRRIFSKSANFYARIILGVSLHDCTNGLRVYTRRTLESIDFSSLSETGYALLLEMAYLFKLKGYGFTEIPSTFVNRKRGKSNTSLKEIIDACTAVWRIWKRHKRSYNW